MKTKFSIWDLLRTLIVTTLGGGISSMVEALQHAGQEIDHKAIWRAGAIGAGLAFSGVLIKSPLFQTTDDKPLAPVKESPQEPEVPEEPKRS